MCTLIGTRQETGWVVASNSDNPYATRNRVVCGQGPEHAFVAVEVLREPGERPVPWGGMLTRGVNSAGLSFTYAYVPTAGDDRYPAQRWTADLIGSASNCAEAIDRIRRIHGEVLPGNYLVADAAGDAVIAEVAATRVAVVEPADDVLACANAWTVLGSDGGASIDVTSGLRAGQGRQLASGVDGTGSVTAVTRDHVGGQADASSSRGGSICNHGRDYGTISSEILRPDQRALWWTYGHPCGTHQGHEADAREPWRRYVRFDVDKVSTAGAVTDADGAVTPLGVRLIGEVETDGH
jgi:hypothetical protein